MYVVYICKLSTICICFAYDIHVMFDEPVRRSVHVLYKGCGYVLGKFCDFAALDVCTIGSRK